MTSYSNPARRNLLATSADEPFLVMIEITHPDLAIPVRVVNDVENITAQGNLYLACRFQITRPDDIGEQLPQARLSVDNIGRDLTEWLEYSGGGKGARCRIIQILRSDPDTFEFDITMDLSGLSIDNAAVSGTLGFQNTLALPAVAVRYDPTTSPGMF